MNQQLSLIAFYQWCSSEYVEYYYDSTKVRIDTDKYLVIKLAEDRLVIERNTITHNLHLIFIIK